MDRGLARCPGCGAWADAAHVIACIGGRLKREHARGWREGALAMLGAVAKQRARRGDVDVVRLLDAVRALVNGKR